MVLVFFDVVITDATFFRVFNLPNGTYLWNASMNDTAGNEIINDTRTFNIDSTTPLIAFTAPTEANGTTISVNHTLVNVTFNESNNDTVLISFGNINFTPTCNAISCFVNITGLADDTFEYYGWINDTVGNTNQTETRIITIDALIVTFAYCPGVTEHLFRPNLSNFNFNITNVSQFGVQADNVTSCLFNITNPTNITINVTVFTNITDSNYDLYCNQVNLSRTEGIFTDINLTVINNCISLVFVIAVKVFRTHMLPPLLALNHANSEIELLFASVVRIRREAVPTPPPGLSKESIGSLKTSVTKTVSAAVGAVVPVPTAP